MTVRRFAMALAGSVLLLNMSAPPPSAAETSAPSFIGFLKNSMGLSDKEVDNLAAGELLVNVFDVKDSHELVLCGVARVDVPWEFALEQLREILTHRNEDGILSISKFSSPPAVTDLDSFSLPDDDVHDLKNARRGSSDVKMTEDFLKQIETEVDWSGDFTANVNRIFREMLAGRASDYLEGGIGNLSPYVDKDPPQTVSDGMQNVLGPSSALFEYAPEFANYLKRFPEVELDGTTDLVYCVLEDFGMKPTVSVRHLCIYKPQNHLRSKFMVAEINLYSSHYFQAMYSLAAFLETELRGEGQTSYVVFAQRFWFDNELKGMKRRSAEGRLSKAMEKSASAQRDRLVDAYRNEK